MVKGADGCRCIIVSLLPCLCRPTPFLPDVRMPVPLLSRLSSNPHRLHRSRLHTTLRVDACRAIASVVFELTGAPSALKRSAHTLYKLSAAACNAYRAIPSVVPFDQAAHSQARQRGATARSSSHSCSRTHAAAHPHTSSRPRSPAIRCIFLWDQPGHYSSSSSTGRSCWC